MTTEWQQCFDMSTARWQSAGTGWNYVINIRLGDTGTSSITCLFGVVKPKKDGRFEWFRKTNSFLNTREGKPQGVCATLEEAQAMAISDLKENP